MLLYQQHQLAVQRRQRAASSLCSLPRSPLRALNSVCSAVQPASRPVAVLVAQKQQRVDQSVVVRAAKDGGMLDAELEATQKTLDKVLAAVQAAQAAQQMQTASPTVQDAALVSREQQLWDRQQALMDRMQQQWDEERKAFLAREQQLLSELAQLRHEVNNLLLGRAAAAAAAVPGASPTSQPPAAAPAAAAAASPVSSVGSSPAAAAAAAAASSAASRPGASAFPGQATISGPTSASAAVAAAIRAVRDEGVTRAPSAGSDGEESDGSWQNLFDSSGDRAVSSVAGALAAVNDTDVLEGLDLSFTSSSRGRRRIGDSSNGSSSSNGTSTTSSTSSMAEGAECSSAPSSSGGGDAAASTSSSSSGGSAGSSLPVEVQKGDPQGPPPVLAAGDDDIYWVSKLHDGLMGAGYYPSDDEVENWFFAESTQTALLTFQACNGLPESGTTCEATWHMLIGAEEYEAAYGHLSSGSNGSSNGGSEATGGSSSLTSQTVDTTESPDGEVTYSFSSSSSSSSGPSNGGASDSSSSGGSASSSYASSSGRVGGGGWPVVMDMDGGREVHALQVCLQKVGYFCGDDDMRWWQFGSSTLDALKTFQACNGLPESGVCDERTWLALLGPEAKPEDLDEVRGDESMYEDDMSAPHEGAVWLVGEQRWSKPAKQ